MAFDFNQFTTVCRLTRDPEAPKLFGKRKVIRFGIAFTGERRKDDNDQWTEKPCFMDCEAWQGETGPKLVDLLDKYGKKGMRVFVVGSLKMEEWEDKNGGGKRRAIKINVKDVIFLDKVDKGGNPDRQRDEEPSGDGGSDSGSGYGGSDNDPIPF